MRIGMLVLAAALLPAGAAAQVEPDRGLEGLWVAREHFGPEVRGTLLMFRRGQALVADIAGFAVPVQEEGDRLAFELPDGRGSFRGHRRGDEVRGHWIQPETVVAGLRFATPVTLRPDGSGRWRGEVEPLADGMTFYLPVDRAPDGRLATWLGNPERNLGRFIPVTRIESEGEAVRLLGARSQSDPESVLLEGRRDAGAGTIGIPINGVTFDFTRDENRRSGFWPRGRDGELYTYAPPVARDDGWPVATLEEEGIDRAAIERFVQRLIDLPMEDVGTSQVHGVLIARHGRLVLEEYFHGFHRDLPHDTRSAAKSWVAVLIGAAMQAGIPIGLDTPVYETMLDRLPADLDPRKRAMTLEHLVSMTAGYDCDGDSEDRMQEQAAQPDWHRYTLDLPMVRAPGEAIVYCSEEANLAAGMLERIAGEPLPDLFDRLVARPLDMGRYHLLLTPTGTAYGGGGHRFLARDFLKLAQLMLNGGEWDGRRILPEAWVRRSGAPLRNLTPTQTYGFLWNSVRYPWRGREVHAFFAAGNGGQIFMGIPELDLAIAFIGGNYSHPALFIPQRVYVPELILPAVE